jgi:MSHA biogenesis protein MshM
MYLEHFGFDKQPFSLTPNTTFYCGFPEHQAALNTLLFSLRSGAGFIKIIGEVGSGKTLLCRMLLNSFSDDYAVAYIPNPDLDAYMLRKAFAKELGVEISPADDASEVLHKLEQRLIALAAQDKKVVLVIDEAQALPDDTLEALRLLNNLETESAKLFQIALFAQPEFDERLNLYSFRQLKQRIVFSHYLRPLLKAEVSEYVHHRLVKAGSIHPQLFSKQACDLLYKNSKGIPRIINVLCHKALLSAFGRGELKIGRQDVLAAINDGAQVVRSNQKWVNFGLLLIVSVLTIVFSVELLRWVRI